MSQEITKEQIAAFDADFSAQRANRVAMNAVTNNGLLASAIRREAVEQDVHEYSISLEQGEICNQKQSGPLLDVRSPQHPALSGDEEVRPQDL